MSEVMNIGEIIKVGVDAVVGEMQEMAGYDCVGPCRAYFEIPVGEQFGGYVRGVYRVYTVQAPSLKEALSGIRGCIVEQIVAAKSRSPIVFLIWRNEEKIRIREPEIGVRQGWEAYARFTVLPEESML